jgi:hypothetical protein
MDFDQRKTFEAERDFIARMMREAEEATAKRTVQRMGLQGAERRFDPNPR